jgi:hypothetical protein
MGEKKAIIIHNRRNPVGKMVKVRKARVFVILKKIKLLEVNNGNNNHHRVIVISAKSHQAKPGKKEKSLTITQKDQGEKVIVVSKSAASFKIPNFKKILKQPAKNLLPEKKQPRVLIRKCSPLDRNAKVFVRKRTIDPNIKIAGRAGAGKVFVISKKRAAVKTDQVIEKTVPEPPVIIKKRSEQWSECGQIFYTSGKAFALASNLRTICLGDMYGVQKFLDQGKMDKGFSRIQRETLKDIAQANQPPVSEKNHPQGRAKVLS